MSAPRRRRGAAADPANSVAGETPVEGLVIDPAAASRTGEDTRRRGWFWHWNSIVTQYAPLLGLKGVGLLNSYTVWTDRREESPHRGYAFPSQQSEADFYGEDRAELITINKILVALDLIEIRKEMVLRTDPQGRRWRVPHNFYRVKDHGDDFTLNAREVMTVAELADRDKNVYRYVRRVFSPRFSPIDRDNVWHEILPEVRQTATWQRLAERTEKEERRTSARTKAGHAARRAGNAPEDLLFVPKPGDEPATTPAPNDSGTVITGKSDETSVESSNNGSGIDVAPANTGLTEKAPTMVEPTNEGWSTAVAPTNTTYHQALNTTTTTTPDDEELSKFSNEPNPAPSAHGPHGTTPPGDAPGEAAAILAFAEANARPATPAERKLLAGLAERFSASAAQSAGGAQTGWNWVTAGIYEAVEAGSAFVAPRRLREILTRWEREGYPQVMAVEASTAGMAPRPGRGAGEAGPVISQPGSQPGPAPASGLIALLGTAPDLRLPHGKGSRRTWEFVVTALAAAVEWDDLAPLVSGTSIAAYQDGQVTVAAPDPAQAERLATAYRDLIERKLSEAMRRPVRLAVTSPGAEPPASPLPARARRRAPVARAASLEDDARVEPPSFVVAECGLWSGQVWSAVLSGLERHPAVGRADFEAWLRATLLLGRAGDGEPGSPLVVGVPHSLAQRRVQSRFRSEIADVLASVTGASLPVEIVVVRDWVAARAASGPDGSPAAGAASA